MKSVEFSKTAEVLLSDLSIFKAWHNFPGPLARLVMTSVFLDCFIYSIPANGSNARIGTADE